MLLEAEIFDDGADVSDDQFRLVDEELDHLCPVGFMVEVADKAGGVYGLHQCRFAAEATDLAPAECLLDRVMVGSVHEMMDHQLGQPHGNVRAVDSAATANMPKPLLFPASLLRWIDEPYKVHEVGNGMVRQQVSGQTSKLPSR